MPSILNERLYAIEEQALQRCVALALPLVNAMLGPDGRAYGDLGMTRGQRIARIIDFSQRGVMDRLRVKSPPTYKMLMDQYLEDIGSSPLETGI